MIQTLVRIPFVRLVGAVLALGAAPAAGQTPDDALDAYYRAVGQFFRVPANEVMILSEWRLAPEEIPVVLYVADRGGISPEAVVALRRGGEGWSALARRYALDATSFHVPLDGDPGSLARVYTQYRAQPVTRWPAIELREDEIVGLVNLRVLSQALGTTPDSVLEARDRAGSWVAAFGTLARR